MEHKTMHDHDEMSFGQMVKWLRQREGKTQTELANHLQRSKYGIIDIERGKTVPLDFELINELAKFLRADRVELFKSAMTTWLGINGEVPELDGIAGRWMFNKFFEATSPPEITSVEPRNRLQIEEMAEMLAMLLFEENVRKGESIPLDCLMYENEGVTTIKDIDGVEQFITWIRVPLTESYEGITSYDKKEGVFRIGLREDIWEFVERGDGRSRFTMAHEIGHVALHGMTLIEEQGCAFRDAVCTASERLGKGMKIYESPEWQANVFASAFLMHSKAMKEFINHERCENEYISIERIAEHFGVSYQAARIRLERMLVRF